jgi:hypothetical protein
MVKFSRYSTKNVERSFRANLFIICGEGCCQGRSGGGEKKARAKGVEGLSYFKTLKHRWKRALLAPLLW